MQIKNLSVVTEGGDQLTCFQVYTSDDWRWVGLKGNPTAAAIIAAAMDEIVLAVQEAEMEEILREQRPDEGSRPIQSINDGDYTPSPKNENEDEIPF